MQAQTKGVLITGLGVLLLVPDALFVRLLQADGLAIAFWRNLVAGSLILAFVLWRQGPRAWDGALQTGWAGLVYVVLFGAAPVCFVLAVTLTSVANVVFILAAMPVFAAILSRLFLGEPVGVRMILTMLGVFAGMALILRGSHGSALAHWTGDLLALGVALCFAGALTALRMLRGRSMLPGVPVALLGSAFVLFWLGDPFALWDARAPIWLAHGTMIAGASALMTLGPRYITAPEVALLILLESILSPLLVWALLAEDPGAWTLWGGAVVIAALVISNMVALRRARMA